MIAAQSARPNFRSPGSVVVTRKQPTGADPLWQLWPVLSVVLAAAAGLLFATGYTVAGAVAFVLCTAGYAAKRRSARK